MSGIKNILVPTDFSPSSVSAARFAAAMGKKYRAGITLLHVVTVFENVQDEDVKNATSIRSLYKNLSLQARKQMKAFLRPLEQEKTEFKTVLVSGYSVAEEILNHVEKHEIDLIVAGTLGRQPLAKMLLGSVAEKLIKSAPCPVMTVRSNSYPVPFKGFKKFLVATDFSEYSQRAFKLAVNMAGRSIQVHVMNVLEDVLPPGYGNVSEQVVAELMPVLQGTAAERMARFIGTIKNPQPVISPILKNGDIVDHILEYAAKHEMDLVFLGVKGMSQQEPILIGRVPERIIRKAHCPVVVVK